MAEQQTTYFQLLIQVALNEDWQGTAFRSMLYSSEKACMSKLTDSLYEKLTNDNNDAPEEFVIEHIKNQP
jgi:hypothetical protein